MRRISFMVFCRRSVAFVLLAATAGGAVAQALRQGPFVAALGLVGAYAVPLLVESEAPHALPLFAYLAVVTSGSLAVLRHRAWWWLVWFSIAGATLWVPLWLGGSAGKPEIPVVAVYLLVLLGLFVAFRRGVPRVGFLAGMADTPLVRAAVRAALWAVAACLLLVAHADHFGATSVTAATVAIVGMLGFAYRDAALDDLIAAAGALAVALLATWNLPPPAPDLNLGVFRIEPDHVANFTTTAILYAALLGGGLFAVLPRVARPGRWAGLSAAAPLLILIIAYWRLQEFDIAFAWTLAALALAALELAGCGRVRQTAHRRGRPGNRDRARRLFRRRARRHDNGGCVRAVRGLVDSGARDAPARYRLGRDPHPGRRAALGRAGDRDCRSRAPDPEPVRAGLSARRDA